MRNTVQQLIRAVHITLDATSKCFHESTPCSQLTSFILMSTMEEISSALNTFSSPLYCTAVMKEGVAGK